MATGRHYLGSFIGDQAAEKEWIEDKVRERTSYVEVMAELACQHPQTAYYGLQSHSNRSGIFTAVAH